MWKFWDQNSIALSSYWPLKIERITTIIQIRKMWLCVTWRTYLAMRSKEHEAYKSDVFLISGFSSAWLLQVPDDFSGFIIFISVIQYTSENTNRKMKIWVYHGIGLLFCNSTRFNHLDTPKYSLPYRCECIDTLRSAK